MSLAAETPVVEKGPKNPPVYDIGQIVDLTDPDTFANGHPHDIYRRMRNEAPVYWHDEKEPYEPGFWALTKHADVIAVSKNPRLFSSAKGGHLISFGDPSVADPETQKALLGNMIAMDPPEHMIYRKMVVPSFTPKAIAALEPMIRDRVTTLLDRVASKGECDFVVDLAEQLPLYTLVKMLGVPDEDMPKVIDWTNRLTGTQDPDYNQTPEEAQRAFFELFEYGRKAMDERRANPTEDLLSVVANTKVEGAELPRHALDGFFLLMVIAGNETTRNTIAGGMLALTEWPDEKKKLIDEPGLIANGVEEMLRWVTPVIYFRRTATADCEIRGQQIAEGEKVTMWYGAANRDEDVFDRADVFDVTRKNAAQHLAFGAGQHFCLGSRLGQVQIRIMFEELLKRFPDIEITGEPRRMRSNFIAGIKTMRCAFTPERAA